MGFLVISKGLLVAVRDEFSRAQRKAENMQFIQQHQQAANPQQAEIKLADGNKAGLKTDALTRGHFCSYTIYSFWCIITITIVYCYLLLFDGIIYSTLFIHYEPL